MNKKILKFEQPASFYFKSAQRLMDGGSYIGALSNMRKAVGMEPENGEYSLCLAEVLTELGRYEESNRLLFDLLDRDTDMEGEALFCMGCNFMGLNDAEKARESFEKYVEAYPDGEFREDVEDFLYYFDLDEIDESYLEDVGAEEAMRIADEGKAHIDNGEYKKAIEVLERMDKREDLVYAKNNLALAYYCVHKLDEAIRVTGDILARHRDNVHANCNMAVFLSDKHDGRAKEYIDRAIAAKSPVPEDQYKIAITLCELKMHEAAVACLKDALDTAPYDEKLLFYMAMAYFNTKHFKDALRLLNDIKKLDYPGVIAEYFIKKINRVILGQEDFSELEYVYQVPADEARRKIKYLNECLKLPRAEFDALWQNDAEFMGTVLWGLEYGDDTIKRAIAGMVADFGDEKAEQILRSFIMQKRQSDAVKSDVFVMLKRMDAAEPYVAYMGGEIVEVKVGAYDLENGAAGESYMELLKLLYDAIHQYYNEDVLLSTLQVLQMILEKKREDSFQSKTKEAAAAILYAAIQRNGGKEMLTEICRKLDADVENAYRIVKRLRELENEGK